MSMTHGRNNYLLSIKKRESVDSTTGVNVTNRASSKKGSYFVFIYSQRWDLTFKIGSQMKINKPTSFFILSRSSLLVSILSSPFFHPSSLTTSKLLLFCFIFDSISYCNFSVSCWFYFSWQRKHTYKYLFL